MWSFRAVAFDLDGTLAEDGRVSESAMAAIKSSRAELRMILVTGRVLDELDAQFPGLRSEFDAVVTENGAVLATRAGVRPLASPVERKVGQALAARGVDARPGQVLLAVAGHDAGVAVDVITALGLDCQVVHNRAAAMILPAGVTKGTGLLAALDELGLSAHNTIAVGDAENDLALLQSAEVGAAVANAVPSLAAAADLRLAGPAGAGVAELLTGELINGHQPPVTPVTRADRHPEPGPMGVPRWTKGPTSCPGRGVTWQVEVKNMAGRVAGSVPLRVLPFPRLWDADEPMIRVEGPLALPEGVTDSGVTTTGASGSLRPGVAVPEQEPEQEQEQAAPRSTPTG